MKWRRDGKLSCLSFGNPTSPLKREETAEEEVGESSSCLRGKVCLVCFTVVMVGIYSTHFAQQQQQHANLKVHLNPLAESKEEELFRKCPAVERGVLLRSSWQDFAKATDGYLMTLENRVRALC